MAENSKTGLYRISWTGDRSTILGQLQGINNKLLETNKSLNDLKLLATMIVDNGNCACEELKKLNIKPEPPVEVFPFLAYKNNYLIAHSEGIKFTFYYISYVKSLDSQNKPADFLIKTFPADWVEEVAISVLDPETFGDKEQMELGFTHKVTYGVHGSDVPDERRTEITIKQVSSDLEDTLVIAQFIGYNDPKFLWYSNKADILNMFIAQDGKPVGLWDHKPNVVSELKDKIPTPFTIFSISDTWVTVELWKGLTPYFTFEPNVLSTSRNAYVVFDQTETGKRIECHIVQPGLSYELIFVGGGVTRDISYGPDIFSDEDFAFRSSNGTGFVPIALTSVLPFWATIELNGDLISLKLDANNMIGSRSCDLIFTQEHSGKTLQISVFQFASRFEFKHNGSAYVRFEVALSGSTESLSVLSDFGALKYDFVVDTNSYDWIRADKTGNDVVFSISANSSARFGVVHFRQQHTNRFLVVEFFQEIV